jgi:hypothetical protein
MVIRKVVVQVMVMSSLCYAGDDITAAADSLVSTNHQSSAVITSQPQIDNEYQDGQLNMNEFSVRNRIESYDLKALLERNKWVRATRSHRSYEVANSQEITSQKRSVEHSKSNQNADCLDCCISCCSDCCSCLWDCFCGLESDEVRKQYAVVASGRLGYYKAR